MNIKHSSESAEWYTPPQIIQKVRAVLGEIELDPATSPTANLSIKANYFFTEEDDSLSMDTWCDLPMSIYLNPPGGKIGNKSQAGLFWAKLMDHCEQGLVRHAIFMAFSTEQLSVSQNYHRYSQADFTVCLPRKRIKFISPYNEDAKQPSHASAIIYIPGSLDKTQEFIEHFRSLGAFTHGIRSRRLRDSWAY